MKKIIYYKFLIFNLFFSQICFSQTKNEVNTKTEYERTYIIDDEAKNLTMISLRLYGHIGFWQKIARWNLLQPPYLLRKGQKLTIKKRPHITLEEGDKKILAFWKKTLKKAPVFDFEIKRPTLPKKAISLPTFNEEPKTEPNFTLSLGNSVVDLAQNGPTYKLNLLTSNLTYRKKNLFSNVVFTGAVTFKGPAITSDPDLNSKFLNSNVRLGYIIPFFTSPLEISLQGGIFYRTIILSDKTIGYRDLTQLQFMPQVSWTFQNGDTISGNIKYASLEDKFTLLPKNEREIEFNLTWAMNNNKKYPLSFIFGYYDLKMMVNNITELKETALEFLIGVQL